MAPSAYYTGFRSGDGLARRAESDDCSGWDCLGDAAQFGIILVIVAFVLVMAYMYWRLQIKPNLQDGCDDTLTPVNGYWELTRGDPNRVSITIYREPRPLSDPEPVETDVPAPRRVKGTDGQTQQQENNTLDQVPQQLGRAHTPDIHLVPPPPPPPPIVWSGPSPFAIPPPPMVGPSAFLQPSHPPTALHSNPLAFGMTTVPCPPDAPPPYFGYAAPPNLQGQHPGPGVMPTPQPACVPPPVAPSTPRRSKREKAQTTPVAERQSQWRRWFSLGNTSPISGHARTLSDSSSPAEQSRSLSPPPSPTPPPRRNRRSNHSTPSRRQPQSPRQDRQARPHPQPPRRNSQTTARDQRHSTPPSQTESNLSSSYLNTSVEAVFDTGAHHPAPQTRTRARAASNPENGHPDPSRTRLARIRPSDTVPIAHLLHQQLSARRRRRRHRRHHPSPDLQFPSPERQRPRVSFTLPEKGRSEVSGASLTALPSSSSSSSEQNPEAQSGGGDGAGLRRRDGTREGGRQPGLAGRVTGTFYRMRRALRGDD
ncbi:uncharacterized protein B0H64DRAFT_148063 [Chaetomium fimeti]|uniref:Uncharacterized protein n=1 Tax=Chaetomium fimeti TaxID=1854472 RepID=A0AAE0HG36_9PEZI|nr:hypothetical protein B0H64DRAFT_148063 [Chaetomium fimeti]